MRWERCTINAGAEQALLDPRRLASLLPVGVEAVEGEFQRGDVIEVRARMAAYWAAAARNTIMPEAREPRWANGNGNRSFIMTTSTSAGPAPNLTAAGPAHGLERRRRASWPGLAAPATGPRSPVLLRRRRHTGRQ